MNPQEAGQWRKPFVEPMDGGDGAAIGDNEKQFGGWCDRRISWSVKEANRLAPHSHASHSLTST